MSETLDIKGYVAGFEIKIDGTKLEPVTSRSINSVTITKKMGQADYFQFKLQDKLEDGKFKLMSNKVFALGNKASVSIKSIGKSVTMQGHIEEIVPRFSDGDVHTFDVSGKDKALAGLAEESGYKCYTKKKDSEIVKAIAGEVGLSAKVDATAGAAPEKKEKKGGTSYLAFIQKMVMQNKGFEFFVSDGNLVFRKSKVQSSPEKKFEWGKNLKRFEPRENLTGIITGVTVRWWDEKKQEGIVGEASASDETAVGSGKTAGKIAQSVYGDVKKTIDDEPVDSKDEAKNIAVAVLCDTNKELVTAEVESDGVPDVEPGEMVEIKGVADQFAGNYYIYASTHTIDSQGYRTEFSIRRNTKK